MLRKQKEKIVEDLVYDFKEYNVVFFADYQGLNVEQMTKLRRSLKEKNAKLRVAKNTLIRIAREKLGLPPINQNILTGMTALILSKDDPITPAKIIKDFREELEKPQIKAIIYGGELLPREEFERLASMPSVEELRAKVVGSLSSPIYGLVFALSGLLRGLVTQIDQLAKRQS